VQWLVDVGMHVEEGDRVAEVLTGGVLFHVPAPASGNLVMVVRGDGALIEVGDMLGVIRSAES
jgi:pyruvate/2-oxoglutarate dehydrogenase complex dihydrolipoamide acyltransferase (E2) component